MAEIVEAIADAPDRAEVPPKRGLFEFPRPSGKDWTKEGEKDTAPRRPQAAEKPKTDETPAKRKKRIERRVGKLWLGLAKGLEFIEQDYSAKVVAWQAANVTDAVMEIAEEDPRILDWFDSSLAVSGYWKLGFAGAATLLPIAAYYGFAPDFVVELIDAPELPPDEDEVIE